MKLCIPNKLGIMSVIALALTLVAASAAFADESSTNIGDASSFQDDAALWAMVDDKAKKDGAVCEETLVSGTDAQPYATAAKRPAKYPIAKGFILVTKDKYKGVVPSGHAGIIYSESTVIEAMPEGVVRKSNNWYSRYKTCYGAYVKNISQAQKDKAANWAKGQMGKPYNYDFYNPNTRKAFYCSQLVWAAYKDTLGINLENAALCGNAIHPSELLMSSRVSVFYMQQ